MVLLLLNGSVAHPHLHSLKNIHLEFPSPNSTHLVQTMDVGILKKIEDLYCRKLVNYSLEATAGNLLTSSSTAWKVRADGAMRIASRTAPSAPYTRPTQRLSRPPPIQKLGAENHMLQLNI